MKWKRVPTECLTEKTFLIIKDDLRALETNENSMRVQGKPKSAADTGTWPPKLKNRHYHRQPSLGGDRPKTANLERPSVLDPRLLNKLDMSLVSKEVLCDSMTRIHLGVKSRVGGGVTTSTASVITATGSSRRRSEPMGEKSYPLPSSIPVRQQPTLFFEENQEESTISLPVAVQACKRRSIEHRFTSPEGITATMEISSEPPSMRRQPRSRQQLRTTSGSQDNIVIRRNCDLRRFDDNNNKNNKTSIKVASLSTVRKKKSPKIEVSTELEVFTGAATNLMTPEPCKTCGRPDQPERFHSHPKGSAIVAKKEPLVNPKAKIAVPKTIQKPVALNFRSEKSKNKIKEEAASANGKLKTTSPREILENQNTPPHTGSAARKPRTVTCYICAREFGTASFPIHEPKCMKAQLVPCWKCGRTLLPDRLEIHERSCKATRKISMQRSPKPKVPEKMVQAAVRSPSGSITVHCQICGRNFGSRTIKLHEPHCLKTRQAENEALPASQLKKHSPDCERSANFSNHDREPPISPARVSHRGRRCKTRI